MAPTEIKTDALPDLTNLATWVHLSAKMEAEKGKKNLLVCVDKAREAKVRPLLETLGYANIPVKSLFRVESAPISKRNLGSSRFATANMWKDFD